MKVLIVDEARDERARLVDALSRSSEVVVIGAVSRLHTALHTLGENPPDVIVTDNQLGDDHASDLIAAARKSVAKPVVVVFALNDSVEERRRCLEAGADRFVSKAAGMRALERVLQEIGGARHATRSSEQYALMGRIAEGVAHDLNNYLGVMDVSLSLMKRRVTDAGLSEEVVSLRRALDLAIRATARITRYAQPPAPRTAVDLGAVIERVMELYGSTISSRVALQLEAVPAIDGVELDLEQRMLQLILDAAGETVNVHLYAPDPDVVRLEVTYGGNATLVVEYPSR